MSLSFPANPTVGQIYQGWVWNGAVWNPILTGVAPIGMRVFTASGTYTPTPGMVSCLIECVGGGGGGGGVIGQANEIFGGGGGGSGGYSRKFATAAQIGASQTITIGAAGAAGSNAPGNGGSGGDSSCGSLCVAHGGVGGQSGGSAFGLTGGGGGVAGTGDIALAGRPGFNSPYGNYGSAPLLLSAGSGGPSYLGPGGQGQYANGSSAPGLGPSSGWGGGGGGAIAQNTASAAVGGPGSPGVVIITEYASTTPQAVAMTGMDVGGFVNKLRNGTFDVWQRGTNISVPVSNNVYTADGWCVYCAGAAVTAQVQGGRNNAGLARNCLYVSGAAGNTDVQIFQRIESNIAASLTNQNVTFQAWIFNGTAAAIVPKLYAIYCNAQDNWSGAVTTELNVPLPSCPVGWSKVAYTWAASNNARNGYEVVIDFLGVDVAGDAVAITEADLRATPNLPTGLCPNPPPPELRPVSAELAFCQRYYEVGDIHLWSGITVSGSAYYVTVPYRVIKRATPNLVPSDQGNNGFPVVAPTVYYSSANGFTVSKTSNSSVNAGSYQFSWTASAEL